MTIELMNLDEQFVEAAKKLYDSPHDKRAALHFLRIYQMVHGPHPCLYDGGSGENFTMTMNVGGKAGIFDFDLQPREQRIHWIGLKLTPPQPIRFDLINNNYVIGRNVLGEDPIWYWYSVGTLMPADQRAYWILRMDFPKEGEREIQIVTGQGPATQVTGETE